MNPHEIDPRSLGAFDPLVFTILASAFVIGLTLLMRVIIGFLRERLYPHAGCLLVVLLIVGYIGIDSLSVYSTRSSVTFTKTR